MLIKLLKQLNEMLTGMIGAAGNPPGSVATDPSLPQSGGCAPGTPDDHENPDGHGSNSAGAGGVNFPWLLFIITMALIAVLGGALWIAIIVLAS